MSGAPPRKRRRVRGRSRADSMALYGRLRSASAPCGGGLLVHPHQRATAIEPGAPCDRHMCMIAIDFVCLADLCNEGKITEQEKCQLKDQLLAGDQQAEQLLERCRQGDSSALDVYWRRNSRQDRSESLDVLDKDLDLPVDHPIDSDVLGDSSNEGHALPHSVPSSSTAEAPGDSPASSGAAGSGVAASQSPRVPPHKGPVELKNSFLADSLLHHLMREGNADPDDREEEERGDPMSSRNTGAVHHAGDDSHGDNDGDGDGDDDNDEREDDEGEEGGLDSMRGAYSSLSQNPVLHSPAAAKRDPFVRGGYRGDRRRRQSTMDEGEPNRATRHSAAVGWRGDEEEDEDGVGFFRDRADTEVSLPEHNRVVAAHEVQARHGRLGMPSGSSSSPGLAAVATFAMGHGALVQHSSAAPPNGPDSQQPRRSAGGSLHRHAPRSSASAHGPGRSRSSSFQTALEQAGVEVDASFDFVPGVSTSHAHTEALKVSPLAELTKPSPMGTPSSSTTPMAAGGRRSGGSGKAGDAFLLGSDGGVNGGDGDEGGAMERSGMDRTVSMDDSGHLTDHLLHSPTMRPRLGSELPLLDDPWRVRGHDGMGTLEDSLRWIGSSPPLGSAQDAWSDDRRRGGRDRADTMGQLLDRDQEVDQYHRETRQGGGRPLGALQMTDRLRQQVVEKSTQEQEADEAASLQRSDSEKMPPPRRQTSDSSGASHGSSVAEWPADLGSSKGTRAKKPQTPRARRSGPVSSRRGDARKNRGSSAVSASPRPRAKGSRQRDDDGTDSEDDRVARSRSVAKPPQGGGGASGGARALPTLISPEERPRGWVGSYPPEMRRERIQRFLEKRQRRVWRKIVKYGVRKSFADSRLRVKGRFVKKEDEERLREYMTLI